LLGSETEIRVRYQETDQMGIAYHANYFIWFEVGRTEFFRQLGLSYKEFEKNSIYLPVIKISAEFKNPAYYDDVIKIVSRVNYLQEVRIAFEYRLYRDQELLAVGNSEHAFVNGQGRPLALKRQNPFIWKRMQEALEREGY